MSNLYVKKTTKIVVELECEPGKIGVKVFSSSYRVKEKDTDNPQIFIRMHVNISRVITERIQKAPTTFKLVEWRNRMRRK